MSTRDPFFPKIEGRSNPKDALTDPGPVPFSDADAASIRDALIQYDIVLRTLAEICSDLQDLRVRAQVAAMAAPSWHWVALLAWSARAALMELEALAENEPAAFSLNPQGLPRMAPPVGEARQVARAAFLEIMAGMTADESYPECVSRLAAIARKAFEAMPS